MRCEDNVGYKMRLIHNRIHKQMEAKRQVNEGDITGMQRWTVGFLKDHDGTDIYQKDIEQEFKVSRATASNMLRVMERNGLITREAVSCDARLKKIVLTEKARAMAERAKRDVKEMEDRIVAGFSEEEIIETAEIFHFLIAGSFCFRSIMDLSGMENYRKNNYTLRGSRPFAERVCTVCRT